jgi:hypothetical protein
MDLRETGFGDVDWIHLAQDKDRWWAVVNTVMNLRVQAFNWLLLKSLVYRILYVYTSPIQAAYPFHHDLHLITPGQFLVL